MQNHRTKYTEEGNTYLETGADSAEYVVMTKSANSGNGYLQRFSTEIGDERYGDKKRGGYHHKHINEALAIDIPEFVRQLGQGAEPIQGGIQDEEP